MSLKIAQTTDEDLVIYYRKNGDKSAIGELFKRHSLLCFSVCNKYLKDEDAAEDAAMQVFEKLFEDLKKHEIQNFRSWLHTVCRNYCLMQLRKPDLSVRFKEVDSESENDFMEFEHYVHHNDNEQEKEYQLQTLELAVSELKDQQKECITLFYLQRKSYEEVSLLTGYTANEVKSYIQNGKRNLKIILNQKGIGFMVVLILWMINRA